MKFSEQSGIKPKSLKERFRPNVDGVPEGDEPLIMRREPFDADSQPIEIAMDDIGEADEYLGGDRLSRRKKKDKEFLDLLLLVLAVENDIARLQAIIEFHEEKMSLIARLIREARDLLTELQEREEALKEVLDQFREKGSFNLDGNGALKNRKAEAALQAYEQKTGKLIDRNNPGSYALVQAALEDVRVEEVKIEAGIEADQEDYERHKAKRDEALEIKEALQSGDPSRQQHGLDRMKELGYDQKIESSVNSLTTDLGKQESAILKEAGLVESDLMQDSFYFRFPPIKDDFQKSATGELSKQEPIAEPSLKNKPLGIAPR